MSIGIYCAGLHGRLFYKLLDICGIKIDWISDGNPDIWGKEIIDGLKCLNPFQLNAQNDIGYICVGKRHYQDVSNFVKKNGLFQIKEISSFIDRLIKEDHDLFFKILRAHAQNESADLFYDINPNSNVSAGKVIENSGKVAVYTSVFGNYDNGCNLEGNDSEIDYFCVSDDKPCYLSNGINWIDAKKYVPDSIVSPIKRNRYIKMHPHEIFDNYQYSIYVDGNVRIKGNVKELIRDSKSGISVFAHPARECIYYEALSICNFKRVIVDDVCKQMHRYFYEGMPMRYGLMEMPVISREHNKKNCIDIMESWWNEFDNGAQRDQLSFMYAMWKNGMKIQDLACLGHDVRNDKRFVFYNHAFESRNVKNESLLL